MAIETSDIIFNDSESEEGDESNNEANRDIVVKDNRGDGKTILTGNTKRDSDGSNLSYVTVTLSKHPYNKTIISDVTGWYRFEVDEGGTHRLYAEKTGYADFVAFIELREGEENTTHIYMEREGEEKTKIYGYVWEEGTDNPIDNAKVTISKDGHNESFTCYTTSDGYYAQEVNGSGDYTVTAEKDGYRSDTNGRYVGEGDHIRIDLELEKESTEETILKGYTRDKSDCSNISNVFIEVSKGDYNQSTYSDGNGYYEFELEDGGTYTVRAEKDGYKDETDTNISVQEGKETTHHIYLEKEGGSDKTEIYGYITEKGTNDSISNADVTIRRDDDNSSYSALSNIDGYYDQVVKSGGNYSITVERDGYKTETKSTYVEKGQHVRLDFILERDSADNTILNGYTEDTSNGTRISHVDIRISKGNHTDSTISDKDGYYEFQLSEGGSYTLTARRTGYKDYEKSIHIEEKEETIHYIGLKGDGETVLHGYALEDGMDEEFVEDVIVTISKGNYSDSIETDLEGYYEFELPAEGQYHILARKDGYQDYRADETVWEGEDKTHTISMNRTYVSIFGSVRDKDTGEPIQDAAVTVTGNDCNCSYSTTTDDKGRYEIEFNVEGNFTVRADKEGYESEENITYAAHHDSSRVEFRLERIVTKVHGYVLEGGSRQFGSGISDVKVHIQSTHGEYTVYSLLTGYYDQELVEGGEFTIIVSKDGYITQEKTVTIHTGEVKHVDFTLEIVQNSKPPVEKFGVTLTASKTMIDLEGKDVSVITLTVRNIGEMVDNYTLSISGTFRGWTVSMDSPETITLRSMEMKTITLTLNESLTESPDGDEIVVDVTAMSQTYPEVQDSVRIQGNLEGDVNGVPDLTVPLIIGSICAGALVASFRRRY